MHFPETAKQILMYRYDRLGAAKEAAKEAGYQGAMFPWQSGLEGTEQSQEIHLNPMTGNWDKDFSRLQRHVSLAVAYNIWLYWNNTHDQKYMEEYGAEMLLEIARFWQSAAEYDETTGKYSIDKVMGPDEFHETYPGTEEGGLKNNAYTNMMVVWLFEFNEQLKGISRMDSLDRILAYGGKENDYTIEQKEEMAADKNANYVKLLEDLTPDDLLPGVKAFLDEAREKKVPCSLASASKNASFILKKLGVYDYFDAIVDPATLKKGKPDPEIFVRAAELINIDPSEAIGFEDAQAGVEGIKGAGMYAIGVEGHEPLTQVDMTIKSFEELNVSELLEL